MCVRVVEPALRTFFFQYWIPYRITDYTLMSIFQLYCYMFDMSCIINWHLCAILMMAMHEGGRGFKKDAKET